MVNRLLVGLGLAAILAAPAMAQSDVSISLSLRPESKLEFSGTSSLHPWECSATKIDGRVTVAQALLKGAPASVATPVKEADVTIPVRSLKCAHGGMNDNMYKAMKADANPTITYRLTSFTLAPDGAGTFSGTARGTLSIAGKENEVTMPVRATVQPDGSVKATSQVALLMTSYGIKPPTMMFGSVKTGDQVTVKWEIVAAPTTQVASAGR